MKPASAPEIRGNWATLLLPIHENDEIDFMSLESEINKLIDYNVDGIYSNGTAGEFYNQTEEEFDRISELLADKCNAAKMPFQIGCNHMSPQIALHRLKRSIRLKPSAIQVILPDWFPPTFEEIVEFMKRLSDEAGGIGLILYNPPHAKVRLQPKDYEKLLATDINLVGCKMPGGDEQWYRDMTQFDKQLSVFIPGHHLATGVSRGAHGAYSNVACLDPLAAQRWYDSMQSNLPGALELEKRIQQFMNECIVPFITEEKYSNQAVDKLMAAVGGWTQITPRLRWPYRSIPNENIVPVRNKAKQLLPEFFND